ncbi:C-type mannose receptor 2-like [Danio rerio]|uniref:C-type mannose receptor 2-like n=1 Tax=Danio rerio TaxID=7955 RepID=A0AC58GSZ8_DANRE
MKMFGLLSFFLLVLHVSAVRPVPGLVNEIIHVKTTMNWYDAKTYCLNNSGLLFVISDKDQLNNISGSANQLSWVGLFRFSVDWTFVDNTKPTYFNWYGQCSAMNPAGYWFVLTCNAKLFFVCKILTGGWVVIRQTKTWQEAQIQCGIPGLAVILNAADNKFIASLLDVGLFWIGLATVQVDSPLKETWRWIGNNNPVTYSQWFSNLFCAVMDWNGFWYDRVCFEKHPFICFKNVGGVSQFTLVNEVNVWSGAQAHCKLLTMDLVMVRTEEDLIALVMYVQNIYSSSVDSLYLWIGLYNNPWYWSSSLLRIQYWNVMQPNNLDSNYRNITPNTQACGALKDGEMFDESCNNALPFFCVATVRSMILVSEPKSWTEALKLCRDRYVDFASLTSNMEQQTAENKIESAQSGYVWIGLNFLMGSWIWVNGDNVRYENWVTGGKLQCPVAQRCGALNVANGMWEARSCDERLQFLCFQK